MSDFSPEWLALREPLDAASRAVDLGAIVAAALESSAPSQSRRTIVDLGAGTGANLRYSAPLLPGAHDWVLIDRDTRVLDAVNARMHAWANSFGVEVIEDNNHLVLRGSTFECTVRSMTLDLANDLARLDLPRDALVSASALLDLVSESWLAMLVERARAARATVWFSLNYDGRIECTPEEPEDFEVRDLVNAHQLSDKGFGAALGPRAGRALEEMLTRHGYQTTRAASDWSIGPDARELQYGLLAGWLAAACEMAPADAPRLSQWHARRCAHVDSGRSTFCVGHVDIVGRCPEGDLLR